MVHKPKDRDSTLFARFVESAFATQEILPDWLTHLYEPEDWQARFAASKNEEPLLLERGVSVNVQPTFVQPEPPKPSKKNNPHPLAEAAKQCMAEAKTGKVKASDGAKPTMTDAHNEATSAAATSREYSGEDGWSRCPSIRTRLLQSLQGFAFNPSTENALTRRGK